MAVVTFHAHATLDGRVYHPGQTAEIPDHWVYPLVYQNVITCLGEHEKARQEYEKGKAARGYDAPSPVVTVRDPGRRH